MTSYESVSNVSSLVYDANQTVVNTTSAASILRPTETILIGFHLGEVISIVCIVLGTAGNTALLLAIYHSSFCRFPYGLLLILIAVFDIVRLFSVIIYYLLQADIIPINTVISTVYIVFYRYGKIVTNWLKVILAIERLITVKYWSVNRYNVHSKKMTIDQRLKQRRLIFLILLLLICALISQHVNFIPSRYIKSYIDPVRLFLINVPNPHFYYGPHVYNPVLLMIISYILIDDVLPVTALLSKDS
ncbi:unnamed protein product [Adineta ricciae]|uniref:G-protein coupled receptors family 1 profile domain-containing protein n=1 Tax=Adineta ricciae TaxID=249248 RepID=A0A814LKE7_ADIRI|nr:unnamed protein product [Adineta ricciae]